MEETLSVGLEHTGGGDRQGFLGAFLKYSNYHIIIIFYNLSTMKLNFLSKNNY